MGQKGHRRFAENRGHRLSPIPSQSAGVSAGAYRSRLGIPDKLGRICRAEKLDCFARRAPGYARNQPRFTNLGSLPHRAGTPASQKIDTRFQLILLIRSTGREEAEGSEGDSRCKGVPAFWQISDYSYECPKIIGHFYEKRCRLRHRNGIGIGIGARHCNSP